MNLIRWPVTRMILTTCRGKKAQGESAPPLDTACRRSIHRDGLPMSGQAPFPRMTERRSPPLVLNWRERRTTQSQKDAGGEAAQVRPMSDSAARGVADQVHHHVHSQ